MYLVATVTEFEKHYVFLTFPSTPSLSLSPFPPLPRSFPFDILHPTVMNIKLNELV